MGYEVKFYKGSYRSRQKQANNDGAVLYIEQHFNSSTNRRANYALCVVGRNASRTSKSFGRYYADHVAREFGIDVSGDNGILIGGFQGRGAANLEKTKMPAVLLEPFFISNPESIKWITRLDAVKTLGLILANTIKHYFPDGGLIAFSVGHKYKGWWSRDKGALSFCGEMYEADLAEEVLNWAEYILTDVDKQE